MQEHDAILVFDRVQMHVYHLPEIGCQLRQFEIMGCEQGVTAATFDQVAGNSPGQREAVVG